MLRFLDNAAAIALACLICSGALSYIAYAQFGVSNVALYLAAMAFACCLLAAIAHFSAHGVLKVDAWAMLATLCFIVLSVYAATTTLWTESVLVAQEKVAKIWFLCALAALVAVQAKRSRKLLAATVIFIALVAAIWFTVNFPKIGYSTQLRTALGGEVYALVGDLLALALIFLVLGTQKLSSGLRLGLTATILGLLVITGYRSALLFGLGSIILTLAIFGDFTSWIRGMLLFVVVVAIVLGMLPWVGDDVYVLLLRAIERFIQLSGFADTTSGASRFAHFAFVFSSVRDVGALFLGHGIGSYGVMLYGVDEFHHPHNSFLEVLFELGVIGLFFWSAFWLISLFRAVRGGPLPTALVGFVLLTGLKASSFADARVAVILIFLFAFHSGLAGERRRGGAS